MRGKIRISLACRRPLRGQPMLAASCSARLADRALPRHPPVFGIERDKSLEKIAGPKNFRALFSKYLYVVHTILVIRVAQCHKGGASGNGNQASLSDRRGWKSRGAQGQVSRSTMKIFDSSPAGLGSRSPGHHKRPLRRRTTLDFAAMARAGRASVVAPRDTAEAPRFAGFLHHFMPDRPRRVAGRASLQHRQDPQHHADRRRQKQGPRPCRQGSGMS